jgi:hypothetical protein
MTEEELSQAFERMMAALRKTDQPVDELLTSLGRLEVSLRAMRASFVNLGEHIRISAQVLSRTN